MRKTFILFAIVALFASCSSKQTTSHGQVTKVADYLYEVSYTSIDDAYYDLIRPIPVNAACSSVRNGSFHGRNLDLFYNESCEVVVHIAASKDRYASMAVCGGIPTFTAEKLENGDEEILQTLPFFTMDGINENNVAVNVNVVPSVDMEIATGTNPGARRLNMGMAPRYILDHAKSAFHAIELLHELDLYGGFGEDFGLHLMISDPLETVIVEVLNNKLVFKASNPESVQNIMTNLYSTLLPDYTPHAEGIERYGILKENYAEGATEEGMARLMQRVKYSQAYERTTDPFWYSECYGVTKNPDGSVRDFNVNTPREEIYGALEKTFQAYERHERKGEFWQTVNTSVYNVNERTLLLYVQEDYEHPYRFKL